VTEDSSKLADILDSIEAGGTPSSQELQILVAALTAKQITMATGERSIALCGSADGAIITSGDRNIVIPPELTRLIQDKMGGHIDFHSGDRNTNIYCYFFGDRDLILAEQKKLPKLIEILESIDLEILKQIYRETLTIDAELSAGSSTNIDRGSIVAELHNLRLIPTFINHLIDDDRLPKEDREALEPIFPRSSLTKSIQSNRSRILESYLSIVIRPSATNSNEFLVNGWLTTDNTEDSSFYALDLDATAKGLTYNLNEMPEILNKFLDLSLEKLKGRTFKLTIEIFLPMDLLGTDVDRWIIIDLGKVPVGIRYRTIVRASDRLEQRYLLKRWSDWKTKWERIKALGNSPPHVNDFESIDCCKSCNWKRVTNNLSSTKLGLKLTSGLVAEHKLEFFKAILRAATPIAVWVRCDLPNLDLKAEIDDLIAGSSLFELSAAVLRKRQQADEEDPPEVHLGAHLVMLWEDPHRLTPDVKSWLSTPGQ
jgi:hypothetical protein